MSDDSEKEAQSISSPARDTTFRLAVYGILIENARVLLEKHEETGLWHPPGQILETGQVPLQVLTARFQSLAHFNPTLGPLIFTEEQQGAGADGNSRHLSLLYYLMARSSGSSVALRQSGNEEPAHWMTIDDLSRHDVHCGYGAILVARRRLHWPS